MHVNTSNLSSISHICQSGYHTVDNLYFICVPAVQSTDIPLPTDIPFPNNVISAGEDNSTLPDTTYPLVCHECVSHL